MPGFAPKLPLYVDSRDGAYGLIKSYKVLVEQNLKNLLLTSPGERIMDPEFGVGIRRLLFENSDKQFFLQDDIRSTVQVQLRKYMPFVTLVDFSMERTSHGGETVKISLRYNIVPLNATSVLVLDFNN